jgi:hypothetical protein
VEATSIRFAAFDSAFVEQLVLVRSESNNVHQVCRNRGKTEKSSSTTPLIIDTIIINTIIIIIIISKVIKAFISVLYHPKRIRHSSTRV